MKKKNMQITPLKIDELLKNSKKDTVLQKITEEIIRQELQLIIVGKKNSSDEDWSVLANQVVGAEHF